MSSPSSSSPSSSLSASHEMPLEEIPPLGPNESRLYVNNIPWSFTDQSLSTWILAESGVKPIQVSIIQNRKLQRSKGYGFVKIATPDLPRALTLHNRTCEGRDIGVQEAKQRSDEERQLFRLEKKQQREERRQQRHQQREEEAGGNEQGGHRQPSKPSAGQQQQRPSGGSHPKEGGQGASPVNAQGQSGSGGGSGQAHEGQGQGQPREGRAKRPPRVKPAIKHFDNSTTLYVTNLAFSVTESQLREFFTQNLGVAPLDVSIPLKQGRDEGRSMGYAFVIVSNDRVDGALALNGRVFMERETKISLARGTTNNADTNANADNHPEGGQTQTNGGGAPAPRRQHRRTPRKVAQDNENVQKTGSATSTGTGVPVSNGPVQSPVSDGGQQSSRPRRPRGRRPPRAGAALEDGQEQ